jgi:hypothetical protein
METRRERKNMILKMPGSQWVSRKNKQLTAKVKAILKKFKFR